MTAWFVIIAAGVGSYLFRLSFVALADRTRLPPVLDRATGLAVPAAFAALAAAALAGHGTADGSTWAPIGAVAAAVVAVRCTRSRHAALLVGMPALWLLSALAG